MGIVHFVNRVHLNELLLKSKDFSELREPVIASRCCSTLALQSYKIWTYQP